ncbi:MAG: xanthine dehydrogenase family protein molybdopterin-binding subunit [Chloroflexota bacterium]
MSNSRVAPQFIGAHVKRREDPALITGQGKYVADLHLDNLLYMAVVRSPYAHAHILEIDIEEALAIPGIVAILTGPEINPHLNQPMRMIADIRDYAESKNPRRFPLTTDKVRHVGDPVAVVLAESPYIATDAVETIFVDYDPLPAVVDPEAALADDAPVIHEAWNDNLAFRWVKDEGEDIDAIFAEADTVVETRVINQRLIPNAMEPRAVTATYDAESKSFTIWSTTQIPHSVKGDLSKILGVPEEQLRVIAPEVGGGFGAKANVYGEEVLVPFLARHLGRPVKWVASRSEDYLATSHGRDHIDTLRLAANAEGIIQAADLQVIADCGGYYARVTPGIIPMTALMMTGVYQIPNTRAEIRGVFTNKIPTEPYRGAGRPEAAYLIERAIEQLALALNIDAIELRRRNFIPPEKFPYKTPTGARYDSGEYDLALTRALELIDYPALRAEQARRRQMGGKLMGIGVACYVEICGFGPWEMGSVYVDAEGQVTILTGTSPHGQGHQTTWAQIAAEVLQIPMEQITVKHGDTAIVPRGIGTFASRSTPVGGSAVFQNAETVRDRAKAIAAHLLEAAPDDMVLVDGRFHVVGVPEQALTWQDVAQAAQDPTLPEPLQGGLQGDDDFKPTGETFPFGAHVGVVEIDPETGVIELVRYLTVDDCGRIINPMIAEGQVHGGLAQGIGQALVEGAVYDETGNLLSGSLMDYALPKADHFPWYETHRTETPSPFNPLGVKGIGEAATIGSTPTIVNAVVDALSHLGIQHLDMPLTAEKVWQALQQES